MAPVSKTASASKPTVLFVGTSLTAGLGLDPDSAFPMLIQRKIDSAGLGFDVVNAGVSGETSSGLLDRLDWLLRGKFDVMVLETGANDGLRGIAAASLRANLEMALDRIRAKRPDARVVLVQMEALPNLPARSMRQTFTPYTLSVAKARKGVPLLPFLLADVAGHQELVNQADGGDSSPTTWASGSWRRIYGRHSNRMLDSAPATRYRSMTWTGSAAVVHLSSKAV